MNFWQIFWIPKPSNRLKKTVTESLSFISFQLSLFLFSSLISFSSHLCLSLSFSAHLSSQMSLSPLSTLSLSSQMSLSSVFSSLSLFSCLSLFSSLSLLHFFSFALLFQISTIFLFSMTMTVITGSVSSLCALSAIVHGPWPFRCLAKSSLGTTVEVFLLWTRATWNKVGLYLRWRWRCVDLS